MTTGNRFSSKRRSFHCMMQKKKQGNVQDLNISVGIKWRAVVANAHFSAPGLILLSVLWWEAARMHGVCFLFCSRQTGRGWSQRPTQMGYRNAEVNDNLSDGGPTYRSSFIPFNWSKHTAAGGEGRKVVEEVEEEHNLSLPLLLRHVNE